MATGLINYWSQFYETILKLHKDSSWSRYRPSYITHEVYSEKRGTYGKRRQLVFSADVVFDSIHSSPAVVEIVKEGESDTPQTRYVYYVLSPRIENYITVDSVAVRRKYPRLVRKLKGINLSDVEIDGKTLVLARSMNMTISYRNRDLGKTFDCVIVKINQDAGTVDLNSIGSAARAFVDVAISDVCPYYNWQFIHKRKIVINNVELFLIGDDRTNNTEHEEYMIISTDGFFYDKIKWDHLGRLVASGRIKFIPCATPVKPGQEEMKRFRSELGDGRFRVHRGGHLYDIFPGPGGRLLLASVSGRETVQLQPRHVDPGQLRSNIDRQCTLYGHIHPGGLTVVGEFDEDYGLWCIVPSQSWYFPVYLRPCELAWLVLLREFRFVCA